MTREFKVLVVDDEPDIVRYLQHILHRLGYVTATADDGAQAIERARRVERNLTAKAREAVLAARSRAEEAERLAREAEARANRAEKRAEQAETRQIGRAHV